MNIIEAITKAESLLPGHPSKENKLDPRWQAIIEIGKYIQSNPREIWDFVSKWGTTTDEDLQSAIATCLLEHLLEYHFELVFNKVKKLAIENRNFAKTFLICNKFGQSEMPINSEKFDQLKNML